MKAECRVQVQGQEWGEWIPTHAAPAGEIETLLSMGYKAVTLTLPDDSRIEFRKEGG